MLRDLKERVLADNHQAQFLRFFINGCICASIHYGIYVLLQLWIGLNISFTVGYFLAFLFNYFSTSYFTFHSSPTWKRFIGFIASHGVNYLVNVGAFNILLFIGMHRLIAPILSM